MNPYDKLVKNRSLIAAHNAAMMFNQTTYRMFKKGQSERIRKFLIQQIGDGRELSHCNGPKYAERLTAIIERFRRTFRMSRTGRRPNFGQAAKVVNLYVKHLLMLPDFLVAYDRRRLQMHAHVPLDRQILGRMWGRRNKEGDFRRDLNESGISRRPKLKELEKRDYIQIQCVLADAVRSAGIPTIAYDYLYALREE
jgi:hypothetical protein